MNSAPLGFRRAKRKAGRVSKPTNRRKIVCAEDCRRCGGCAAETGSVILPYLRSRRISDHPSPRRDIGGLLAVGDGRTKNTVRPQADGRARNPRGGPRVFSLAQCSLNHRDGSEGGQICGLAWLGWNGAAGARSGRWFRPKGPEFSTTRGILSGTGSAESLRFEACCWVRVEHARSGGWLSWSSSLSQAIE